VVAIVGMRNFLAGYISPRTDVHQMRENLSLLSFWGLVFSLIAATLFVVIYSYQKNKYANREIVEDLRQRSVDVYLAAKTPEAESDSKRFREASNEIERLLAETRVLFWLIIAMNTAVIIIFILAYQSF
jgi:type VI protein secretion system component VasK